MSGVLAGKAVVVTGSGAGIGRGCALEAAAEGARVVVNDIRAEAAESVVREIRAAGGEAMAHVTTVSTWEGARSLIDACVRTYGRIDGLVNNAGISFGTLPWEESEAEMRAVIDVNLLGTLFCGRHAMAQMVKARSGAIVNMSSRADYGSNQLSTYAATKGGMKAAAASWAKDLQPYKVRLNVVHPGAKSSMPVLWEQIVPELGYGSAHQQPGARDRRQRNEDRPPAAPAQVGPLAVYLLSDRCDFSGRSFGLRASRLDIHPAWVDQPGTSFERERWTAASIAEVVRQHPWPQRGTRPGPSLSRGRGGSRWRPRSRARRR